jgi:hypothetical protein
VGDWDFVWDFARFRGAYPLIFVASLVLKSGLFAGISCDGETRTRTGDTTIFSSRAVCSVLRAVGHWDFVWDFARLRGA